MLVAQLIVRCHSWSAEGGGSTAWRGHISVKQGNHFCLLPYTWRNVLEVTQCGAASVDLTARPGAGRGTLPTFLRHPTPTKALALLGTVTLPIGVTLHLSTSQPADGGLLWDITLERIAEDEEAGRRADGRSLAYGYYYGTTCFEVWQGLDSGAIDNSYLGRGWCW